MTERNRLENAETHGKLILRWIFKKWEGETVLDWSCSGQGQVACFCQGGNEPSGVIKSEEILHYMRAYYVVMSCSAAWSF